MRQKHTKTQWVVSGILVFLSVAMVIAGVAGFWMRSGSFVQKSLSEMRAYAVLRTAAGAIIDDIALEAKKAAREYADANKYSRNQRAAYALEKETEARVQAEAQYAQFDDKDTSGLDTWILELESVQKAYAVQEAKEKAAYAIKLEQMKQPDAALDEKLQSLTDTGEGEGGIIDESDLTQAQQETVDYSGFTASETLLSLQDKVHTQYELLWVELIKTLPDLTEKMKDKLEVPILAIVYEHGSDFEGQYDRFTALDAQAIFTSGEKFQMMVARSGDDLITIGIGLFLFSLGFFFYKPMVAKLGMPRMVILAFFVLLCVAAGLYGISVPAMIGNVLKRTGMFGVLALAMLPGIQCGITLNMGMTSGIIGGLLSTLIALEYNMTGWGAFLFSVIVGCLLAMPIGWLYSKLLNRLKGNEMTVSTYVGFSIVSLMSIAWMLLPFRNPKITWALGTGLRVMHNMGDSLGSILNNLWSFKLFGATIPTGLLLFFFLCCFLMWLFSRSKTGTAMIAAGSNPRFAEAAGINVNRMRTIGTTISTVIAAVGIIVYSQSFGFMQLYSGPRQMGFIAASAILIGGASVTRAKVSNVILGTFLFQGVLALGIQVANAALQGGGLSEVMRILISNGIILYALTQSGGESRV
jgi:simple sugar transport system permease protein